MCILVRVTIVLGSMTTVGSAQSLLVGVYPDMPSDMTPVTAFVGHACLDPCESFCAKVGYWACDDHYRMDIYWSHTCVDFSRF